MKSASDIWICSRCRSINPLSRGKCYRCNTPKEVAAARPEDLSIAHHEQPPEPTGEFRSSEMRAVLVTIAVVAFILATLNALWINWLSVELRGTDGAAASQLFMDDRLPLLAIAPVTAVAALVAFGLWIRRVVENLPTLGVGYSRVSPTWAFFEPLIPGFNVYAIPARMGEAIQKLGGIPTAMPLLGLAIVIAIAPVVVTAVVIRFSGLFGSAQLVRMALSFGLLATFVCQSVALSIGLGVMWKIEGRTRVMHESLASAPASGVRAGA